MNLRKIGSLLLMFAVLICPLVVYGDGGGVEVNPAYITGRIILNGYTYTDVASSANVYANATGNFNSNVQVSSDGSYTLTVNTPADGSPRTYNVYARVYLKSGAQFDAGATVQIATVRGETYTQNFSQSLATLTVDGSFTNDDWTYLSPYYNSGSSQYLYFYMSVSKTGTHSFLIPANIPFRWVWGSASPKDTNKYTSLELVKKEFTAQPGETVELNWTGTFPDKPVQQYGTVRGSISFSPLPEGALSQHYLYCSPTSVSITKDGAYRLDNAYAGTQYSYFVSYFNNNRQYLYWPYRYINPNNYNGYIDVPANGEVVINISDTPAMVKGKLSLTGIKSLSDTSSTVQVYASGVSNTNTYGGQAYDSGINKNTGEYSLYLTPGTWDVGYYTSNIYFNNNSSNPANYMYTYFTYYDYTRLSSYNGGVTVAAGQVVEGYDIEIPTGMVTMKFISTDGSLIKSPYIQGSMSEIVNGKTIHFCNVYGNGSSQEVQEAQVTFIAPPGTYTLNTQAIVNGSNVTFSPQSVVVVEGVHTVIEVNGPKLTLNSPVAELYTYDQQITVSGTATDDVLVKSVTLNGQNLSIQPTGNPNDPHEVSFETTIPLVNGPNKIEVVATDSANKVASDTRFVYKDNAVPTLTVTPTNGTVTSATAITLMGTATDDNQITKLTVNGLSVDFYSTNNPEDPNEVYFSKTYNLVKGANRFSVTAYDNCKRSTTVLNIITSADEDTVPPVFAPIQAITLELATSQGTAYTLTKPAVTDNIDPKPQVTSDAPAVFPLGTTQVTWKATDAMGNTATAIQNVIVVDTTKPVLTVPADLTIEATGKKTLVDIGQATASDLTAVMIISDAPEDGAYSLGTTIVTWTATDANGNVVIGTQTITVVDTTKPILDVPADINVEATDIKTPVNIGQATGSDIFPITITSDAPADGKYSLGTTVVTWTATDANGNKITGAQTITVVDSTQPVLDVPADINVEATAIKTPVNIGQATGSDIFPVTITSDAPADGKYSLGTTVVTWTAADANGNEITGTQTITVVDTTQPVLNIPANMRVEATAIKTPVNIGQAAGSDIFPVTITSDAPADGKYSLGTTVVTWTATDANGNVTTATQKITVVDTTKPILNVPANIIIKATGAKTFVNIGQATATDIFAVTIVNNAPTDGKYTLGTTIVTWTATDANGNQASGTQRITVVGSAMAQQLLHYGGIEVNQFNSNGAISIYGSCRANLLSTTKSAVLITSNANQVGTILTNQPIGAIPLPNLPVLTGKTTIPTSVPPNPTLTNNRFEKSTMISSTVKINGLLVVKGDLTINGNVTLNNAAIYCTGKITVSGSINGSGLIYAGAGFTHYGNLQLSGSLLVNGTWEVSGTTKITDDNNQSYLEYLIF